jgi:hypothetical protein
MARIGLAGLLFVVLIFGAGCAATSAPTDQAPSWVQAVDRILQVEKSQDGTVKSTGNPDPTSGTIPIVGLIATVAATAWAAIRAQSKSVPAATHDNALNQNASVANNQTNALANSQPVPTQQPLLVVPAVRAPSPS